MHTKDELVKKKAKSEQLDLTEIISTDNKLSQKRLYLFIDASHWSVSANVGSTLFNWSKNKLNLSSSEVNSLTNKLIVAKNSNSKISPYLPTSINIKENFSQNDSGFLIQSLILIPHQQLLFVINYQGPVTFPPSHLPELVSSLYWTTVQALPN